MRDPALHSALESFAAAASAELLAATQQGSDLSFEVVEETAGRAVLYRYRALVEPFVDGHAGALRRLEAWPAAVEALVAAETGGYLSAHGDGHAHADPQTRADAAALVFVKQVFDEASSFEWEQERFDVAYQELEDVIFLRSSLMWVAAARLPGIELELERLELGDGLALVSGQVADGPPPAGGSEEPTALFTYVAQAPAAGTLPTDQARAAFRGALTALRLYRRGEVGMEEEAFTRHGHAPWQPLRLGLGGHLPLRTQRLTAQDLEGFRSFYEALVRRASRGGPLQWALRRFELGCERADPLEGLSDHLLALRGLLDDGDDESFALRLAALCAGPEERGVAARQVEDAIALERTVRRGLVDRAEARREQGDFAPLTLAGRLEEHLRAILRDALSGALERDLRAVADEILVADAPEAPVASSARPAFAERPAAAHRLDLTRERDGQLERSEQDTVAFDVVPAAAARGPVESGPRPEQSPGPAPVPEPAPQPAPEPEPVPMPEPYPEPQPVPVPEPEPEPDQAARAEIRLRAVRVVEDIERRLTDAPEPRAQPELEPAFEGEPDPLRHELAEIEDAESYSAPV